MLSLWEQNNIDDNLSIDDTYSLHSINDDDSSADDSNHSLPLMLPLIQCDNDNDLSTNNSSCSQWKRTRFEVVKKASQCQVTQDNADEFLKHSMIKGTGNVNDRR